jgi:hypothetical protein
MAALRVFLGWYVTAKLSEDQSCIIILPNTAERIRLTIAFRRFILGALVEIKKLTPNERPKIARLKLLFSTMMSILSFFFISPTHKRTEGL